MGVSRSAGVAGFATTDSAADTGERHLEIYEVLEEEFARLHPGPVPEVDWSFTAAQILDITELGVVLCEAMSEQVETGAIDPVHDAMRVVLRGADELRAAVDAWRRAGPNVGDGDPASVALVTATVRRLDALLDGDLLAEKAFRAFRAEARVSDADAAPQRIRRANRLLLEAAFKFRVAHARDLRLTAVYERIRGRRHAALCLSGGGIRSATFALGVLRGLACAGILGEFDYLSTVSGGGFIGGWLSAWMKHDTAPRVQEELGRLGVEKLQPEAEPVRHLRAYSSYLTPRLGMLSADTWTLVATLMRNMLLNWLVLVPLLCAGLMLSRIAISILMEQVSAWGSDAVGDGVLIALLATGILLGTAAIAFVHSSRPDPRDAGRVVARRSRRDQRAFVLRCLVPLVASAVCLTLFWWLYESWILGCNVPVVVRRPTPTIDYLQGGCAPLDDRTLAWFAMTGALMHVVGWLIAVRNPFRRLPEAIAIAATGALAGFLVAHVSHALATLPAAALPERAYIVLAVPAFLAMIILGGQLFIGLASSVSSDAEREWSARFNAFLLVTAVAWLVVGALSLYGPPLIEGQDQWSIRAIGQRFFVSVGGVAGLTTLFLGKSTAKSAGPESGRPGIGALLQRAGLALATPIFAAFLIVLLSQANARIFVVAGCYVTEQFHGWLSWSPMGCRYPFAELRDFAHPSDWAHPLLMVGVTLVLAGAGLLLGRLIDSNRFSLHAMYRARLIRAYLGASRAVDERTPDPFTGFDEHDNLFLKELWPATTRSTERGRDRDASMPPLHVVNTALNLVATQNLAWQQRKAASFTFTPLHAGSAFVGYRRTSVVPGVDPGATRLYGGRNGVSIGTAITISGAAASPNSGYHSSPTITFLMTLFNARLGWWLGNPGPSGAETFGLSSPKLAVVPILSEMFGMTTDQNDYVFLSDGGHFENLGLYEMVLRRCRFILVSDAGCDPTCTFEDLGNALRKIRIDLGVSVEFGTDMGIYSRTAPPPQGEGKYWAVGRIRYSAVDGDPSRMYLTDDDYDGILLYVKPALYGTEPRDVYNYAQSSPAFPHESTTDQFFSESQFESYRALGSYIIGRLCEDLTPAGLTNVPLPFAHPLHWFDDRQGRAMPFKAPEDGISAVASPVATPSGAAR